MIDDVISFDVVIRYQAITQKTTYTAKFSIIATTLTLPSTHYCAQVQVYLVLLQTVTGLVVYMQRWAAQVIKVAPQAHAQLLQKSCAASVSASPPK